jgi:hypothetical protein
MTVYTTLPTDDLNLAVTVIDDPDLVQINITPASINLTGAVNSVNGFTGVVSLTTTEIPEGTNEYYTDARADARVDLQTGANLDLSFMDTDDLAEGPTNLYYTAARDSAQFNTDLATKDTDDLSEGSNLYFTDARAQTVITANTEAFIKANSTDTLTNKSGSNSQWTNTEAYIKADSTDTLTNKSGSNNQWTNDAGYITSSALTPYYTSTQVDALPVSTFTNDAGYITSETDSQTLSFTTPTLTISNGNNVDLTPLKTTALAFSAITATPTTVAGYGITDAFDGVYASLTGKPTIPTNNNQLTNGAGYSTTTGTVTPSSTDVFTNKSGNISQWTNDSGYLTSETDSQTLTFTSPSLAISNGNSQDLSALTDGGTY